MKMFLYGGALSQILLIGIVILIPLMLFSKFVFSIVFSTIGILHKDTNPHSNKRNLEEEDRWYKNCCDDPDAHEREVKASEHLVELLHRKDYKRNGK